MATATATQAPFTWEGTDRTGKKVKGKVVSTSEAAVRYPHRIEHPADRAGGLMLLSRFPVVDVPVDGFRRAIDAEVTTVAGDAAEQGDRHTAGVRVAGGATGVVFGDDHLDPSGVGLFE